MEPLWIDGTTVRVNAPQITRWVLENNFKSPMVIWDFPLHPFIAQTTTVWVDGTTVWVNKGQSLKKTTVKQL